MSVGHAGLGEEVEHLSERARLRPCRTVEHGNAKTEPMQGKLVRVYNKPWKYEYKPYRRNK